MKRFSWVAVSALALILVLPGTASAIDFGVYGSMYDSNDLSEAFGLGVVVAFDINESFDFDINIAYFEDWENRFEDVEDLTKVEMGVIPVDFGFNWHSKPDGGFAVGGGATYGFVDIGGLDGWALRGELQFDLGDRAVLTLQYKHTEDDEVDDRVGAHRMGCDGPPVLAGSRSVVTTRTRSAGPQLSARSSSRP